MKKRIPFLMLILAGLLAAMVAGPVYGQGQGERVAVLIGFTQQPGPAEQALVRGAGGDIKYTYNLVPAISASLPEGAIQGLLNNPNVTVIEPDIEVRIVDHPTGDPELDNTWG
ncbi:MAG: hypothetical protein IIC97_11930, partial [Chloroflexi bacterium]|nr:hypothetical protein [Chloroflexota bacterium]